MTEKWYVLNISGSLAEQMRRERIYNAAAKDLGLPLMVEHNAAPSNAKDIFGDPFYGPKEVTPDFWWCLVWSAEAKPKKRMNLFWDLVAQMSHESDEHAHQQPSLVSG